MFRIITFGFLNILYMIILYLIIYLYIILDQIYIVNLLTFKIYIYVGLPEYWTRIIARIAWLMHIIMPIFVMFKSIYVLKELTLIRIYLNIKDNIIEIPITWIVPIFTWIISLSVAENLRIWRQKLEQDTSVDTIRRIRLQYVKVRGVISLMDQSMKLVYFNMFKY